MTETHNLPDRSEYELFEDWLLAAMEMQRQL
jgi:hypothetical protein